MGHIDLGWLRIFHAVGSMGSLSAAAQALNLTQPAVSYQIRRLEEQCGVRLLRRQHRGVELTEAGAQLFEIAARTVTQTDQLVARLRRQPGVPTVRLHTDYAFSALWLIPRIDRFRAACPDLDIQIVAQQRPDLARLPEGEVGVVFGARATFGDGALLLMAERVVPVCAPTLAEGRAVAPDAPAGDLAGLRLIHLDAARAAPWFDWRSYLDGLAPGAGAGAVPVPVPVPVPVDPGGLSFNTYSLVVQAAVAGQGVALGWRGLVDDLLAGGMLVPVGPEREAAGRGYFLVRPHVSTPDVARLIDWLIGEALG